MGISKNIRSRIGHYRFLKELRKQKREPEVINFDAAVSIGLLYDATDERNTEIIKNYVKSIRSNYKKDVLAMGYVDKRTTHKSQYAQFGLDFFTRKELNFGMIPVDPIVSNFIKEKFDILINLNPGKSFPIQYVSSLSHARFKVGRYTSRYDNNFDMMVKIEGEPSLKNVLEEIENFLRIIHTS